MVGGFSGGCCTNRLHMQGFHSGLPAWWGLGPRHLPGLLAATGLDSDFDAASLATAGPQYRAGLKAALDTTFASKTSMEWEEILSAGDVWHCRVANANAGLGAGCSRADLCCTAGRNPAGRELSDARVAGAAATFPPAAHLAGARVAVPGGSESDDIATSTDQH